MQPLVIIGSARPRGNTRRWVDQLFQERPHHLIDLHRRPLTPYDYTHRYPDDDPFGEIVGAMLDTRHIVLATPVYWYAMSGVMKDFFDRLTDLLIVRKEAGRKLAGKQLWVLATGSDARAPEGFWVPFERTAAYFDMHFGGSCYRSACDTSSIADAEKAFLESLYA
ncbi:MAG: NAD(P)H-dependent oxidoreductase [Catalinimonas sp.]